MVNTLSSPGPRQRGVISRFIDDRQREGRYTFTDTELAERTPQTAAARQKVLWRLQHTGRILRPLPKHAFFVIVPHEYHSLGAPPSPWYLDALLNYLDLPTYYVALLTAAQWHGASHFAVQETQVIVPKQLRPIKVGRESIRFFTKSASSETAVETKTTDAGPIRVSTPEATAVDLVRYSHAVGSLNFTATVLVELMKRLESKKLVVVFENASDLATAQRLGYLLETLGGESKLKALRNWIVRQPLRTRPLETEKTHDQAWLNEFWHLWINTKVEPST